MQTHLSEDLVRKYQEDGFLHVPQLLAPAEVAELKSAVLDAIGAMKRSKGDVALLPGNRSGKELRPL